MRLIDADKEILKIEAEIERIKERIKKWEENRADRSSYDVDEKIKDLHRNISDAKTEIRTLKHYATAYDVDKVVGQLTCEECEKCALINVCNGNMLEGFFETIAEIVRAGGVHE